MGINLSGGSDLDLANFADGSLMGEYDDIGQELIESDEDDPFDQD